jgi:hypothetical protein
MSKKVYSVFLIVICQFFVISLFAQDSFKEMDNYHGIDISYIFGGQLFNDNFIYNPGFTVETSYGKKIDKRVGLGIGTGYMSLTHEQFIPFFMEVNGYFKDKKSTPLIKMKMGYAYGWSHSTDNIPGYDFEGGFFFDAGFGRKIEINKKYSVMFHWSYRHQFGEIRYSAYAGKEYNEALNFDMFVLSLGIIRETDKD